MYKNCKLILTNYYYKSITNTLALQINKKHVRTLLVITLKTIHRHYHHHYHQAVVGFGTTYGNNKKIKKNFFYGNYIFLLIKNLEFFHNFKD